MPVMHRDQQQHFLPERNESSPGVNRIREQNLQR